MTMPSEILVIVEGAQDAAVVSAMLAPEFICLKSRERVPDHWKRFIPTKLPSTDKLPIRIDHPRFLHAQDGRNIFLRVAGSVESIPTRLNADLKDLAGHMPDSIGILLDADSHSPADRMRALNAELGKGTSAIQFTGAPGAVAVSNGIRCGVFVAPNNAATGTIERMLLEAGEGFAPDLLRKARSFITGISAEDIPVNRSAREFEKWERSKSILHAMGSVLRPGRPTQATLEDDPWFGPTAGPMAAALRDFFLALTNA